MRLRAYSDARCGQVLLHMHMGAHAPGMRGAGPDPEGVHAGLPTLRPYGRLVQHCSMRGCFNIGMHMHIQIHACMHAYICLDMNLLTADALHAIAKPSRLEPSIIRLAGNL